ncbi:Uncharacterised protein [Bordetella pertussis]|nr:Uncharacterised protein [Bordetella pertussis]CFU90550.1 Uncharacterised protein [Bordetella pertussis]CPI52505.1 Uncharacterised protein [Bordetella pertussis]CPL86474.1 Uncharacterised protein [Bordetella pertussis]CPM46529.1 Uncharacterised protein [Bordetella pertussis]
MVMVLPPWLLDSLTMLVSTARATPIQSTPPCW